MEPGKGLGLSVCDYAYDNSCLSLLVLLLRSLTCGSWSIASGATTLSCVVITIATLVLIDRALYLYPLVGSI